MSSNVATPTPVNTVRRPWLFSSLLFGSAEDRVFIWPIPTKFVFLFPTIVLAGILWIVHAGNHQQLQPSDIQSASAETQTEADKERAAGKSTATRGNLVKIGDTFYEDTAGRKTARVLGQLFVLIALVNFVVVAFDFPRNTVLIVVLLVFLAILGLWILEQNLNILGPLGRWLTSLDIRATGTFYGTIFWGGLLLLLGVYVMMHFNYWELTPNEMIHRQGLLGDEERYSTAGMKFSRDITDAFEYLVFRTARLQIKLPSAGRDLILETVLGIDRVQQKADNLLRKGRTVTETEKVVEVNAPIVTTTSDT